MSTHMIFFFISAQDMVSVSVNVVTGESEWQAEFSV